MAVKTGKNDRKRFSEDEPRTRPGVGPRRTSVRPAAKDPGPMRPKLKTMGYDQRPVEKPAARPMQASSPELIMIGEAPVGRATMAAIEVELMREAGGYAAEAPTTRRVAPGRAPAPAEVFEVVTFVVQGEEIFSKVSERARRDFVKARLLHRLPVLSMADVTRIDLTRGAAADSMVLRVWCRIAPPPA
jgi:hypothetical protein